MLQLENHRHPVEVSIVFCNLPCGHQIPQVGRLVDQEGLKLQIQPRILLLLSHAGHLATLLFRRLGVCVEEAREVGVHAS